LDARLLVFCLLQIALPALHVSLLGNLGISAARSGTKQQSHGDGERESKNVSHTIPLTPSVEGSHPTHSESSGRKPQHAHEHQLSKRSEDLTWNPAPRFRR